MSRKAVIDFSAFVSITNDVIIKELTVVDIESGSAQHWIFKPPKDTPNYWSGSCAIDRHNGWLSKHYHGIEFYAGFTQYEEMLSALNNVCSDMQTLYAPDLEKARVLERLFNARRLVFSLEALGCPQLQRATLFPNFKFLDVDEEDRGRDEVDSCGVSPKRSDSSKQCLYHRVHSPGFVCTLDNALQLAKWCAGNLSMLDMNESTVREKTFVNWNVNSPTAKELADAGFVRVHSTVDATKCVYCGVVLCKWEENDAPDFDHDYNSPFCNFVRYNLQLKRDQYAKDKKKHSCCQAADEVNIENEFYLRYGNTPDVTLMDLVRCVRI